MPFYYYIILVSLLAFVILLIRHFIVRRKTLTQQLISEALKNENNGHFEEAVATYKTALTEIKKGRGNSKLENTIIEKLKVLNTNIEYNNNIHLSREHKGG